MAEPCLHESSVASVVSDSASPWTAALQAPRSMGFSRQESWSGLPCPPPGDLPSSGIKPTSPSSPALQVDSLLPSCRGSPWLGSGTQISWSGIILDVSVRVLCGSDQHPNLQSFAAVVFAAESVLECADLVVL